LAVERFQRNWNIFNEAQRSFADVAEVAEILRCSPFHTVSVQQWLNAFTETGWKITDQIMAFADKRISIIQGSLICEEQFNIQKNAGVVKGAIKQRKPERAFGVAIAQKFVSKRYKWESLQPLPCKSLTAGVDKSDFGIGAPDPSISLKGIASNKQAAPYFSPNAEGVGRPTADLTLLHHAVTHKLCRQLHTANLGKCSDAQHPFVFRCTKALKLDVPETQWYVGLAHYNRSCSVVWPISLTPVPQSRTTSYVEFGKPDGPVLLPIMQWKGIIARPVAWKGWRGQLVSNPGLEKLSPGVRLLTTGPEESLVCVAARQCYWKLTFSELCDVAAALGWPVASASTLLEVASYV
jgi:hypothetical protein